MKFKEREPYYILTKIPIPPSRYELKEYPNMVDIYLLSLCHFCRYAEWNAGSWCDDSGDMFCKCGIEKIEEDSDDTWISGNDCWAFKPRYIHEDCVDAVGMLIDGWIPDWSTLRLCYKPRKK
jgi:hypothetical protein